MGEWPEDLELEVPDQVFVHDNLGRSWRSPPADEFNRQNPPVRGLAGAHDLYNTELIKRPWRNNKGLWFDLAENRVLSTHLAELAARQLGQAPPHDRSRPLHRQGQGPHGHALRRRAGGAGRLEEGSICSPPCGRGISTSTTIADDGPLPRDPGHIHDQAPGLHQIERHPTQLKIGEGTDYVVDAVPRRRPSGARMSTVPGASGAEP